MENYNENSNEGYAFGFHAEYTEIAKVGNIAKFVWWKKNMLYT